MKYYKPFVIVMTICAVSAQADMQKCQIRGKKGLTTNYFDKSNQKERAKCLTTPETVLKARKKSPTISIKTTIRNAKGKHVATNAKCKGSGGTVKANGRTFHLDLGEICRRYGAKHKGSIKRGVAKHVKLNHVNKAFQKKFTAYINRTARKHRLDPAFIHAIISAESAYNPNATSRSGAMGLMQLMPMTAKRFGVTNAYHPYQNVEAGTKYLRILLDEFGTLELAAAGYNAGEGSVRKYNRTIPPYRETMAYVPKVMKFYRKYKKNKALISIK